MKSDLQTSARRHAIVAVIRTLVFWFPVCLAVGADLTILFFVADGAVPLAVAAPVIAGVVLSPLILTVGLPLRWAATGPRNTLRPAAMTPVLENVVTEIALALGKPVESIVVHDSDVANVAMLPTGDGEVVVATKGALDLLSRYELQALVAAQFAGMGDRWCRVATRAEIMWGAMYALLPLSFFAFVAGTLSLLLLDGVLVFFVTAIFAGFIGFIVHLMPRWNEQGRDLCADVAAVRATFDPLSLAAAMRKLAGKAKVAHEVDIGRWYHPISPFLVVPRRSRTATTVATDTYGGTRTWTSADEVGMELELRADRAEAMADGAEPNRITGRELSRRWNALGR